MGNLYALFQTRFNHCLDAPCFVLADGASYNFADIDTLSARFAALLRTRGVTAGARVVVQANKSIGAVALYLACLRVGAIYTPLNTAYTDAEVAYFVEDAEPTLVVRATPKPGSEVLGENESSPLWTEARGMAPDPNLARREADDIAAILYTSGTTGRSKGAMLSIGNLFSNALTLHKLWGFRGDDVLLHALPIFHVHGLFVALHCALLNATPTIFLPKFDAGEVRALLTRATVLMGVPTFYTRLLGLPSFGADDCRRMRLFISGSAPLLADTHRDFHMRTGHRILERYGMTEAGMITSNPLDGERVPGTVGFPLPDVMLRVADENGAVVGRGEPGVIEIQGPNVFRGYWRMPEKTAQEFRPDGFFVTGDVGVQAADGRVSIVGRAKDLIISGGYNIYPAEIEAVLNAVAGVGETAVVGAPHPDLGEAPVAVIACDAPSKVSLESLELACSQNLARFKHPRHIVVVNELPRNAMGKVQKALLREAYHDVFVGQKTQGG